MMKKLLRNYLFGGLVFSLAFSIILVGTLKVLGNYSSAVDDSTLTNAEWTEWRVPQGAVMAFDLTSCPNGRTRYSNADNRFVMGASSSIGSVGGASSVSVGVQHIPNHSHYFRDTVYMEIGNSNKSANGHTLNVDTQEQRNNWPGSRGGWDNDNSLFTVYRKTSGNILNSAGNSHTGADPNGYSNDTRSQIKTNLNIQNPYVKLLYCKKL